MNDKQDIVLKKLKKETELDPGNPEKWIDLGDYLCEELSLYNQAINAFKKAKEILPDSDLSLRIGECLVYSGEIEEGMKIVKESVSSKPRSEGYIFLANIYNHIDDYENAREAILKAISLDEENEEAYTLLAELEEGLKAIELYRKAISINPYFYDAWIGLGKEQVKSSSFDKAISAFNKSIEINPMEIWGYVYLANAYWSIEEIEKAKDNYSKAMEIEPNSDVVRKWYSDFLKSIGDHKKSEQILNIETN